jgi:hypothetical protein
MSTVVLVDGDRIEARRPRLLERLEARWRRLALDRELAEGALPETCGSLILRAHDLIGLPARRALARDIRRLLREAGSGYPWTVTRVPMRRSAILAAADELELLAHRLVAPDPVAARGVAEVRLLLSDGGGPLYFRGASYELSAAVARARRDLEVRHASA